MVTLKFVSYDTREESPNIKFETVEKIESVSFAYDGGRLSIFINGKSAHTTFSAGNDYQVDIEVK